MDLALTGRCVGLESGDDARLRDLVRSAVIHIHSSEEKNVALLCDSRCDSFHDLAIDRLLIVSNKVLVQKLLNLVRGEPPFVSRFQVMERKWFLHPADILDNLDIIQSSLFQLQ